MHNNEETLRGELTEKDVLGYTDPQWRSYQFRHMVSTNKQLSEMKSNIITLENKIGWRTLLAGIPWAIMGTVIGVIIKCM